MQIDDSVEGDRSARAVLSHYWGEVAARGVFFRGIGGGFSGSRVWEVRFDSGPRYCLKRWPIPGPDRERLSHIHRLLAHLAAEHGIGIHSPPLVPTPLPTREGATWTEFGGRLWELMPMLSGAPKLPDEVTPEVLAAAMQSVAAIHLAMDQVARASPADFHGAGAVGPSPGLKKRREMAHRWYAEREKLAAAIPAARLPEPLRQKCTQLLVFSLPHLRALIQDPTWGTDPVPRSPCVGDLWYAHVLFDQSQVSGIIDFGSTRVDSVLTDLARLLGSWNRTSEEEIAKALDVYSSFRPLTRVERGAFAGFDRTSRVLSAIQWIEWLAVEQRPFDDWDAVSARLDFVLARLPA